MHWVITCTASRMFIGDAPSFSLDPPGGLLVDGGTTSRKTSSSTIHATHLMSKRCRLSDSTCSRLEERTPRPVSAATDVRSGQLAGRVHRPHWCQHSAESAGPRQVVGVDDDLSITGVFRRGVNRGCPRQGRGAAGTDKGRRLVCHPVLVHPPAEEPLAHRLVPDRPGGVPSRHLGRRSCQLPSRASPMLNRYSLHA